MSEFKKLDTILQEHIKEDANNYNRIIAENKRRQEEGILRREPLPPYTDWKLKMMRESNACA